MSSKTRTKLDILADFRGSLNTLLNTAKALADDEVQIAYIDRLHRRALTVYGEDGGETILRECVPTMRELSSKIMCNDISYFLGVDVRSDSRITDDVLRSVLISIQNSFALLPENMRKSIIYHTQLLHNLTFEYIGQ